MDYLELSILLSQLFVFKLIMDYQSQAMRENSQTLKVIVQGNVLEIKREALLSEIEESQKKMIQDKLVLPSWVSIDLYMPLDKYLKTKNLQIYKQRSQDTTLLIQTLRLTDYLGMTKFQEKFISDVITGCLNNTNCVIFLEQTHRKLKNQENGSQCWYSLLNASITYLAVHLREVYKTSADKLKRLHEKILNEILDRAIRNGNLDDDMIFQLIMESRKSPSVDVLCANLRIAIENKKINPKIHAKLSWKLQDVSNIKDKKTKNFKFLDYEWLLEASRSKTNELIVKLNFCGVEGKCEIGAFYVKVIWWVEGKTDQKKEQLIKINYLLMKNKSQLKVLVLSEQLQKELGSSKVQLSIFCCMDQIYTFTLNYLSKHHEKITIDQRKLTPDELYIIVELLREKKQFSSSIRFMKFLAHLKGQVPQELVQGYPLSQLTPYQFDFIQKMSSQKILPPDLASPTSSELIQVRSIASQSRRSDERPQSKGRLRKIFASSPSKSIGTDNNQIRLQDINKITSLKNYFYDKNHPFISQL